MLRNCARRGIAQQAVQRMLLLRKDLQNQAADREVSARVFRSARFVSIAVGGQRDQCQNYALKESRYEQPRSGWYEPGRPPSDAVAVRRCQAFEAQPADLVRPAGPGSLARAPEDWEAGALAASRHPGLGCRGMQASIGKSQVGESVIRIVQRLPIERGKNLKGGEIHS